LPSEHAVSVDAGVCAQPDAVHSSVVHSLPSSQVAGTHCAEPESAPPASSVEPPSLEPPSSVSQVPLSSASAQVPTSNGGVAVSREANSTRPAAPSSTFLMIQP
jgi:hypothetical protein